MFATEVSAYENRRASARAALAAAARAPSLEIHVCPWRSSLSGDANNRNSRTERLLIAPGDVQSAARRRDPCNADLQAWLVENMKAVKKSWVFLVGPGGAGKSTVGALLAARLGVDFADLDHRFSERAGDISDYINRYGYAAYARENVETFTSMLADQCQRRVVALSSGFMTYSSDIHPDYARLRRGIEQNPTSFVLLPSLDRDLCIIETVRRQLERPFARSAAREAAVIRERFPLYVTLRARKIETRRPPTEIVEALLGMIP